MEHLGMAIRQVTEHHLRPSGRQSPLLPYLKALGSADSLPRFITASAVLVELNYETVSPAWRRDFLPALQAISDGATSWGVPPPPLPSPQPGANTKPPRILNPEEGGESTNA